MKNRKNGLALAAVLIVVLAVAWYYVSPGMALNGLREAALKGDRDALSERIDFPKVRESLKSQARAKMMAEIAKEKDDNPFAALGGVLALGLVNTMVDNLVTPDGIKMMMTKGKLAAGKASQEDEAEPDAKWTIERDGLNRFRAMPKAEHGESVPALVFHRDGLGWKLVDIEIPDGS